jgi:cellulose biosynthesis protein BcsQ
MTPDANIDEIVLKSSVAGLDFLPANRDLGTAETTLGAEIGGQQYLKRALGRLRSEYDVILIDCQPTMGQLTINALVASDEVIVPLQCEYFALHGFIELKGNIDKVCITAKFLQLFLRNTLKMYLKPLSRKQFASLRQLLQVNRLLLTHLHQVVHSHTAVLPVN